MASVYSLIIAVTMLPLGNCWWTSSRIFVAIAAKFLLLLVSDIIKHSKY